MRYRYLWLVVGLGMSTAHGATPAAGTVLSAEPTEPELADLSVFVGIQPTVEADGKSGVIENLSGDVADLVVDGRQISAPAREVRVSHVKPSPKVAGVEARVENLKGRTWTTVDLDPKQKAAMDGMRTLSNALDQEDVAVAELRAVEETNARTMATNPDPSVLIDTAPLQDAVDRAQLFSKSEVFQPGNPAPGDVSGDRYTAIFDLSSDTPLRDAYVVVVLVVRTPDDVSKPRVAVRLRQVRDVTVSPTRVKVDFALPMGFAVEKSTVHVFSKGCEIPTNLTVGRVPVTRNDAFDLLLAQYLFEHQDAQVAPVLVRELLPRDHPLPADQVGRYVTVTIDRTGRVSRVALAPVGDRSKDDRIEALVREALFYPALVEGQPVDGTIEMTVDQFVL